MTSRTERRRYADRLFSLYIRRRAGGRCERCGRSDVRLDCAHFLPRRYWAVRWEPSNAAALCSGAHGCHRWLDTHPASREVWIRDRVGAAHWEGLKRLVEGASPGPPDYDRVIARIRALAASEGVSLRLREEVAGA